MSKKKSYCSGNVNVDAEEYYYDKIEKLRLTLEKEEVKRAKSNSGFAFIVFKSKQISMRFKLDIYLKEKLKRTSYLYELLNRKKIDLRQVRSNNPYLESDLKWENIGKDWGLAQFKRLIFFILIVLFSVLILTPTYAYAILAPVESHLKNWFKNLSIVTKLITAYFQPLIVIFINFVVIPGLIDISVLFEDHRRESSVQVTIIRRIYFFMILNTLLIPITFTSTALEFF